MAAIVTCFPLALIHDVAFNLLDARGAISVTERTGYIARIRNLARACGMGYLKQREAMAFPLMKDEG